MYRIRNFTRKAYRYNWNRCVELKFCCQVIRLASTNRNQILKQLPIVTETVSYESTINMLSKHVEIRFLSSKMWLQLQLYVSENFLARAR